MDQREFETALANLGVGRVVSCLMKRDVTRGLITQLVAEGGRSELTLKEQTDCDAEQAVLLNPPPAEEPAPAEQPAAPAAPEPAPAAPADDPVPAAVEHHIVLSDGIQMPDR